jgi:signal transduction histidine kinase
MRSLQARLSLGLLVGLVIVFVVQWYVAHRALEYLLIRYATIHLEEDAETLLAALRLDDPTNLHPDPTRLDSRYQRPFSGQYFVLDVGAQTTRSRSLWDYPLRVPRATLGESTSSIVPGPADQQLLLVVRGFRKAELNVVIAVAEDIGPLRADVARFQWQFAALAITMLGVLIVLHMLWVRRGLFPLKTIQHELDALEAGEVRKLTVELAPSEVQPLVRQVNRLLGAVMSRLDRSRRALGNLAHALKTPLTALTQEIERPEIERLPEVQSQLRRYSESVRELVERELKRARIAGAAMPTQRYDLAAEIDSLLQTLRMVHRDKGLDIVASAPQASGCPLDREDMFELLGNLLDNACKWARTKVRLTVSSGPDWAFAVEDDGPGVADHDMGRIAQRGVRMDESTSGHGLGLSIVKDLVEDYNGTIAFDTSPELGGLRVVATIPTKNVGDKFQE